MPSLVHHVAVAAVGCAMLALTPQSVLARYNCAVKATKDGFVALRDGPAASNRLIARMKGGELVGLLHPPDYDGIVRKGNWIFVRYVPGAMFAKANEADYDKAIPGWVNNSLIACHE